MSIDIKNFVEDCRSRGLTDHSIATYKSNIATFLKFVGNPLNVDTSILCKFLDYLKEEMVYKRGKINKKGVHPKTVKAYFSAISTYYDYLVYTRQIETSPIPSFTKRYLSRIKQQYNGEESRQLISVEQMKQLINLDMPIQDKAILMILAKTGVRRGELLAMDIEDLNLEKKEIILKPKAKRTNRLVLFDDETAQVLRLFLEWRKTRSNSTALFISLFGLRLRKDEPNEIIARYGSKFGLHDPAGNLNKKLTPHCCRHFFTTHLRRAGMSREFIQELRGDRRKDAIDIYDHIDLSELKNCYLECIPKLLSTQPKFHITDVKQMARRQRIMISKPLNLAIKPVIPYGSKTKAILSLLKEHPEGLTISQVAKLLNEKYRPVGKRIYEQLKSGTIQRDDLSRYSLAPQSCLIPGLTDNQVTENIATVTETTPNNPIVTEIPGKARKRKKIIGGFTVELYEFVKNNEGLTAEAISQRLGKKNNLIRPYLHRLKDYGYLINDNGYWKIARETVIESSINLYPSGQSFGFSAPLPYESKATV
ncbi:MAG TPA: tyrosine-type recombinase/integrase [Candidatus Wunengus sp. YC60]|uniref:tyrosine-type recombinase/integrase n=1 Tax=Candidatus Wunengus sp. YC60 TaxID=3367697 RepID=UPI004026C774